MTVLKMVGLFFFIVLAVAFGVAVGVMTVVNEVSRRIGYNLNKGAREYMNEAERQYTRKRV